MRKQLRANGENLKANDKERSFTKFFWAILSCSLLLVHYTSAQISPNSNYPWIKVQTAKIATANPNDLNDPQKGHTVIQYLDGYGRSYQVVNYAATPQGKDIISGAGTLDALGRPDKSYLSIPATTASGQYFNNVETAAQTFYNDSKPYSKVAEYEASPMSRVLKSFSPGEAFQTVTSQGTQQNYEVAGAGIRKYVLIDENTISGTGTYTNGQLIRTWTQDEDGNESIEYRGAQSGRLIQTHQ